jgi:hypothetical protein
MGDEHRTAAQPVGRGADVVDVVGYRTGVEPLRGGAGAVSPQAYRDRAIARIGEEIQEVAPTRRRMPAAVDEEQRDRMSIGAGPLVDHLEHDPDLVRQRLWFVRPFNPVLAFAETETKHTRIGVSYAWLQCRGQRTRCPRQRRAGDHHIARWW